MLELACPRALQGFEKSVHCTNGGSLHSHRLQQVHTIDWGMLCSGASALAVLLVEVDYKGAKFAGT